MRKKVTHALRIKPEVLDEIDRVCDTNAINRSTFVNLALRHYLTTMAKAGLLAPLNRDEILAEASACAAETERRKQESMAHPADNSAPRRRGRKKKELESDPPPLPKPKAEFYPSEEESEDIGLAAAEEEP